MSSVVFSAFLIAVMSLFPTSTMAGVYLPGTSTSYARYPRWHSCSNASLSFEFRAFNSAGLLVYADDGGRSSFVVISYDSSAVTARLNVADGRDDRSLTVAVNANVVDGAWHGVELRRERSETILTVDRVSSRRHALGSQTGSADVGGGQFGDSPGDSHVFVGGIPAALARLDRVHVLTLPSVIYEPRFKGYIRNLLYGNCTCLRVRAGPPLDGDGFVPMSGDAVCSGRHNCSRGCLCISTDHGYNCDCTGQRCLAGIIAHYDVPMDVTSGNFILNPSELDVILTGDGAMTLVPGINGKAVQFDGLRGHVAVATRGFGFDCFGDFDKCTAGFSFSVWLNVTMECQSSFVVLSVGPLDGSTSGMYLISNDDATLAFLFWRRPDVVWRADTDHVIVGRWHHLAVTWSEMYGLATYVDGKLSTLVTSAVRNSTIVTSLARDRQWSLNGKVGDVSKITCPVFVDDFRFISKWSSEEDVKELGAQVCFTVSMDHPVGFTVDHSFNLSSSNPPRQVPGKVGPALLLNASGDYLIGSDKSSMCIGNLGHCRNGLTVSMWIYFIQLRHGMQYLDTGNNGLRMFFADQRLTVTATTETQQWLALWRGVLLDHWYFIEISWNSQSGLELYADRKLVANGSLSLVHKNSMTKIDPDNSFYIGRARSSTSSASVVRHIDAMFIQDDINICYGDRRNLARLRFIHSGRPPHYVISMDSIQNDVMPHTTLNIRVHGGPVSVPGKLGNATRLDGEAEYIDLGDRSDTCLGSLIHCVHHGLTLSIWVKFRRFETGMCYLSSGDGIKIFYRQGRLMFEVSLRDEAWLSSVTDLQLDTWYFIEVTWTAGSGLRVYVNDKLHDEQIRSTRRTAPRRPPGRFLIGYTDDVEPGALVRYGDFIVDEMQFWYADRKTLIAFDFIARGNTPHYVIHMDQQVDNSIVNEGLSVKLHHGARLAVGKVNNALLLRGPLQHVSITDDRTSCLCNLDRCQSGITIAFFVRITPVMDSVRLLTSDNYQAQVTQDGRLHVRFSHSENVWQAKTEVATIQVDRWHRVELSWHPDKGAMIYVDRKTLPMSPSNLTMTVSGGGTAGEDLIYIGHIDEESDTKAQADLLIDEVDFWFADRDQVKAFGWVDDDINVLILDMEKINNDLLVHPTHVIYVHGSPRTVPAKNGNGILLNGLNQYVDVGKDIACKDNLQNCPKGFTLRFAFKPFQLADNTFFISSASVDIYFKQGYLITDVRTSNQQWRTSSQILQLNQWQQVDVSWHSSDGVELFIDDVLVDSDTQPATNEIDFNITWRVFIGRANSDMRHENFANAIFDDVQFWETRRSGIDSLAYNDVEAVKQQPAKVKASRSSDRSPTRRPLPLPPTTSGLPNNGHHHVTPSSASTTLGFYVQIPTGLPVRDPTLNTWSVLPTLIPRARKKLMFDGRAWIKYDLAKLPAEYVRPNTIEQLSIKFQTNKPNGLLWFSGNEERNMHLSLKNGIVLLIVNYNKETKSDKFKLVPASRLDDNRWHSLYVTRRNKQVTVTIDGIEFPKTLINITQLLLARRGDILVGGSENTQILTDNNMRNNFHGIIDKVVISGNTLPGDINLFDLTLLKPTPSFVEIYGNVNSISGSDLPETAGETAAITFTRPESYVRLARWNVSQTASIELNFKTVEPHGLVVYCGGRFGMKDFFAIELFDGIPYVLIDFGDRVHRFTASKKPRTVNDGLPHLLKVEFVKKRLRLVLDDDEYYDNVISAENTLETGTFLYIGAVDNPARLSWHLWTSNPKFFVGCIWGFRLDGGDVQDLPYFASDQMVVGVERGCKTKPLACAHPQCAHGRCADRWDGFVCVCDGTPYTGQLCNNEAPLMVYTGNHMSSVTLRPVLVTHTNDASVRFKTPRDSGLLFLASSRTVNSYLKAFIEHGRIKLETNMGETMQTSFQMILHCGERQFGDDNWHTVYVRRRANYLEGWADDCQHTTAIIPGEGYSFDVDRIAVANSAGDDRDHRRRRRRQAATMTANAAFTGHMQSMKFGSLNVFELLQRQQLNGGDPAELPPEVATLFNTGELSEVEKPIPIFPVTFKSYATSSIHLPTIHTQHSNGSIQFMFRTVEPDALLFFNGGTAPDFMAAELDGGRLRLSANDGGGSVVVVHSRAVLNDNAWHLIEVRQTSSKSLRLTIDGARSPDLNMTSKMNTFDLLGPLYVGGLPDHVGDLEGNLYGRAMMHRSYVGCLATINVDGKLYDVMQHVTMSLAALVVSGCHNTSGYCLSNSCLNGGTCREDFNKYVCDCNMTSYVGRTCNEEAEGYHFGSDGSRGLLAFRVVSTRDKNKDTVVLGFMTWYPNGTLVRMSSGASSDSVNIKLENGHVVVVYEIGNTTVDQLEENGPSVNDGRYHSVVMTRHGTNVTLTVDNTHFSQTTITMYSSSLLNYMSGVTIGGAINHTDQSIYGSFNGIVAGVYVNSHRLLELAVHGHEALEQTRGDVIIATHPFFLPRPTTATLEPTSRRLDADNVTPKFGHEHTSIPEQQSGVSHLNDGVGQRPQAHDVTGVQPTTDGVGVNYVGVVSSIQPIDGIIVNFRMNAINHDDLLQSSALMMSHSPSKTDVLPMRSMVVTGTILCLLIAASSILWAVYKFKPGIITSKTVQSSIQFKAAAVAQKPSNGADVSSLPVGVGNGIVYRVNGTAFRHHTVVVQTILSESTPGNTWDGFTTLGSTRVPTFTGSGVAGLLANDTSVTRGTQTDLVTIGLGCPLIHLTAADSADSSSTKSHVTSLEESDIQSESSVSNQHNTRMMNAPDCDRSNSTSDETETETETESSMSIPIPSRSDIGHSRVVLSASASSPRQPIITSPMPLPDAKSKPTTQKSTSLMDNRQSSGSRIIYGNSHSTGKPTDMREFRTLSASALDVIDGTVHCSCLRATSDGLYVVTGSSRDSPQVWSTNNGQLVRVLESAGRGSTDLHLAFNDLLLVGQVSLDGGRTSEQLEPHNSLQIWDFAAGIALDMAANSAGRQRTFYTASTVLGDSRRLAVGRMESPSEGGGVTIIVYDLVANESIHRFHHACPTDGRERVSYVAANKNDRYLVAGFQRSRDNIATFVVFDLESTCGNSTRSIFIDAQVEVCVMADDHLALTGTRSGSLVVWSLASCTILSHLIGDTTSKSRPADAHSSAVTSLDISGDLKWLVSASRDALLKTWKLKTATQLCTFQGHTGPVLCCAFSANKKMIVSGSTDCTVRVWHSTNGLPLAICQLGLEVREVLITNSHRTVVAIVTSSTSRKLVMLQLMHAKSRQLKPSS